jgi:hypothetical protein
MTYEFVKDLEEESMNEARTKSTAK